MHQIIETVKALVDGAHPGWGGFIMAVAVSIIRVIYDRDETSVVRILLEALVCGFLSVAAGSAFAAMGYGDGWYLFAGGFIGFMGSQAIRALAYKVLNKKIGGDK